jgi:subtilisin family serine protease
MHEAICNLVNNHDVTVVVAAGNNSQDSANFVPAAYGEVITVSAIATNDALRAVSNAGDTFAPFSNFGADVDITAPGVDILSTALQPRFLGQYSELSGTSFSAPHVAAAAALFIRSFLSDNGRRPTPAEVKAGLIAAAEAAPPGGWPGDPDGINEPLLNAEGL